MRMAKTRWLREAALTVSALGVLGLPTVSLATESEKTVAQAGATLTEDVLTDDAVVNDVVMSDEGTDNTVNSLESLHAIVDELLTDNFSDSGLSTASEETWVGQQPEIIGLDSTTFEPEALDRSTEIEGWAAENGAENLDPTLSALSSENEDLGADLAADLTGLDALLVDDLSSSDGKDLLLAVQGDELWANEPDLGLEDEQGVIASTNAVTDLSESETTSLTAPSSSVGTTDPVTANGGKVAEDDLFVGAAPSQGNDRLGVTSLVTADADFEPVLDQDGEKAAPLSTTKHIEPASAPLPTLGRATDLLAQQPTGSSVDKNIEELIRLQQEIPQLEQEIKDLEEQSTPGRLDGDASYTGVIPNGFGSDSGTVFTGFTFQERTRFSNDSDFSAFVGFSLGNARDIVNVTTYYAIGSLSSDDDRDAGDGVIGFHIAHQFSDTLSAAVGLIPIEIGEADLDDTYYGVVTKVIKLNKNSNKPFNQIALTAGLGSGIFRTEDNIADDDNGVNVFGGVGVEVVPCVNLTAEWTGQDLSLSAPVYPLCRTTRRWGFQIVPALRDIAGIDDSQGGARFTLSTSLFYNFD